MDIFKIINIARTQLDEPDLFFHEECATILALLRAKGILAVNRTQVNGQLHYLFGAKGYLDLGDTVRDYIKDVQKVTNNVERWNATELIT